MLLSGLVSVTFRKLSPQEIIALVREAGLHGIEWGGDLHVPHGDLDAARRVRDLTRQAGLQVAAYGSYYRAGKSEQDGLSFSRVLETARTLEAPTIRVWPGHEASADTPPEARRAIVDDLLRVADLAAAAGLTVSTEFHGGTLTDTNDSAERLLAEAAHPALRTYWQPHNGEATPACVAGLRGVARHVSNVHVFHWWPSAAERHPLAAGAARWSEFLGELRALPGERYCLLEFVPDDAPADFLRDAATLRSWLA